MEEFYYTYILQSKKDGNKYAGYTKDLNLRFEQHQNGEVESTKHRRPLKLIFFSAFPDKYLAASFEQYLKTNYGRAFRNKHFIK